MIYGHSWCFSSSQIVLACGSCNFENLKNISRAHISRNALAFIRFPILIVIKTRIEITSSTPAANIWQINYEKPQPRSSPILTVKTAGLAWVRRTFLKVQLPNWSFTQNWSTILIHVTPQTTKRISYYQMLLQSVCTKRRVQTLDRWCWTVVSRQINISALMMIINRKFSRICWCNI